MVRRRFLSWPFAVVWLGLLSAVNLCLAQDVNPEKLIGSKVFSDPSSTSPVLGKINDFVVVNEAVGSLIVDKGGAEIQVPFERAQVFAEDGEPHVVIANDDIVPIVPPNPEPVLFLKMPAERRGNVTVRQQALDLTFYGQDAAKDVVVWLIKVRKFFGIQAFRTNAYTIQAKDTVCAIYASHTHLPLNATRCPLAVEDLNALINPKKPFVEGTVIEIPQIDIVNHGGQPKASDFRTLGLSGTYSLRLPVSAAMAAAFFSDPAVSGFGKISVDFTNAGVGEEKTFQNTGNWQSPTKNGVCEQSSAGGVSVEKSYYYLFDWLMKKGWKPSDQIKNCAMDCASQHPGEDSACADLVLVDQPTTMVPDLALMKQLGKTGDVVPTSFTAVTPNSCNVETFDRKTEHGTHLASIIGSRADGQGFVGISPGLNVFSYPWTTNGSTGELSNLIVKRIGSDSIDNSTFTDLGPQVFVFASRFPAPVATDPARMSYPDSWREGSHLRTITNSDGEQTKPDVLRLKPTLQKNIADSAGYSMWVVAAMQKDTSEGIPDALEIDETLAFSPVNLGDLPNVIVVTACDHCKEGDASVWRDAFFSKKFVQVAAPGLDVMAPVGPGEVAEAGGTSQAAAIVGGLVGAMLNCYPREYREQTGQSKLKAAFLKQRLQYTSKPIFYEKNDLERVASGIVDPEVALLDPSKNWIKLAGEDQYQELSGNQDVHHWCQPSLTMMDQDFETKTNSSKNMLRMVRVANPRATDDQNKRSWIIYSLVPSDDAKIDRFDPRNFPDADAENLPLLARVDGTYIFPKSYDDIILTHTLKSEPCP